MFQDIGDHASHIPPFFLWMLPLLGRGVEFCMEQRINDYFNFGDYASVGAGDDRLH